MLIDARRACALVLILPAIGLAACGDDEDEPDGAAPAPGQAQTLQLDAVEGDGGLGFDPVELSAGAGSVTIEMANPEGNQFPHAVALEGGGVDETGETVQAGGTSTVTADFEAGEYTFYCPVGDHRAQGMEGTLVVE